MKKSIQLTTGLLLYFFGSVNCFAEDIDDIRARAEFWAESFDNGDPDLMVSLYSEEAILHGTASPVLRKGTTLIREYFSGAGSNPPRMFFIEPMHIRIFGDIALNTGNYAVQLEESSEPIVLRYSMVYRKLGDQWLIIDHHSSLLPE